VPAGVPNITLSFEYLPRSAEELGPDILDSQWQRLLLYPAGWYAQHPCSGTTPDPVGNAGLHCSQSRPTRQPQLERSAERKREGPVITFYPESLNRLVDAPVYAGRHVRQIPLRSASNSPVHLDLLADSPADLVVSPLALTQFNAMVAQTEKVFGSPPFSHYDILVSLSDDLSPGGGLEHLEEGENNLPARYFSQSAQQLNKRDLIVHEYVHAWNGRCRQPSSLWSADFNTPTDPSLLWVYEGQTEFWGRVLAARSNIRSYQEALDRFALDAALVADRPGRAWKDLADSTLNPLYMAGHPVTWRDWQRREDYYPEGVLLWLDVDAACGN